MSTFSKIYPSILKLLIKGETSTTLVSEIFIWDFGGFLGTGGKETIKTPFLESTILNISKTPEH